jgi:hypothetical protein
MRCAVPSRSLANIYVIQPRWRDGGINRTAGCYGPQGPEPLHPGTQEKL